MTIRARLASPLTAQRLRLDPLAVDDAIEMVQVLSGSELYSFIGGTPPDLETLRRRFESMTVGQSPDGEQEWLNWVVRRSSDGAAVGTTQATIMDGGTRGEVAWIIGLAWQGSGYGCESAAATVAALKNEGVEWITAHVHPDHAASVAVARCCGLQPTGSFYDGEQRWEWRRTSGVEQT